MRPRKRATPFFEANVISFTAATYQYVRPPHIIPVLLPNSSEPNRTYPSNTFNIFITTISSRCPLSAAARTKRFEFLLPEHSSIRVTFEVWDCNDLTALIAGEVSCQVILCFVGMVISWCAISHFPTSRLTTHARCKASSEILPLPPEGEGREEVPASKAIGNANRYKWRGLCTLPSLEEREN